VVVQRALKTGITFFTQTRLAKGEELATSPYASGDVPCVLLGRQVHVRRAGDRVSAEATADYGSKRPRGSHWRPGLSHQSNRLLAGRHAANSWTM